MELKYILMILAAGFFILFILLPILFSIFAFSDWKMPVNPTYNGKINFNLEGYAENISLSVGTKAEYPLEGYLFANSVNTKENNIYVVLGNVQSPLIKVHKSEPAVFKNELNLKEGNYTLEFQFRDNIDTYSLQVFKDKIEVNVINATCSKYVSTVDGLYDIKNTNFTKEFCVNQS